jgi:hypothetical protein
MSEQLRPLSDERKLSRRELIRRGAYALAATALAATAHRLTEGISLSEHPLILRTVSIDRMGETIQLLTANNREIDEERVMSITSEGKLLFEPNGEFFSQGREFSYIHRANSTEVIHKAHDMGANLFDIDANDVDGTLYAEHGIVPQFEWSLGSLGVGFKVPAVVDQNEMELKLGMPKYKYEQLVACVASLSTAEHPLAVSAELKRGDFDRSTLEELLDIHQRYNVPVIVNPSEPHQLDVISNEIT